jgi:hypothetical protein
MELPQDEPDTVVFGPAKELHYDGGIIVYRQCALQHPVRGNRPYGLIVGARVGDRDEERGSDGQIHVVASVVTIPKKDQPTIAAMLTEILRGPISFS